MNKIKLKPFAAAILLPLAAGALAAIITKDAMADYALIYKPLLSPPGWVFPVVWTLLYAMMGYSSYLIAVSEVTAPRKKRALLLYAVQLAVNVLWPVIFFSLKAYFFAFLWLVLLIALVAALMLRFRYIDSHAEKLLIPYFVWLCYAAYLSLGVFLLN